MYDPTIFENLKVAFENQVYDLDNLERKITMTNRADQMDFATLTRSLSLRFTFIGEPDGDAEIVLLASLGDLAGEILEMNNKELGCSLLLRFRKRVHNITEQCRQIEQVLNNIWENDIYITQTLSFMYGHEAKDYLNNIEVRFKRKINEELMREIPDFLNSVLRTLEMLIKI